jgi:hypothetical protein
MDGMVTEVRHPWFWTRGMGDQRRRKW